MYKRAASDGLSGWDNAACSGSEAPNVPPQHLASDGRKSNRAGVPIRQIDFFCSCQGRDHPTLRLFVSLLILIEVRILCRGDVSCHERKPVGCVERIRLDGLTVFSPQRMHVTVSREQHHRFELAGRIACDWSSIGESDAQLDKKTGGVVNGKHADRCM